MVVDGGTHPTHRCKARAPKRTVTKSTAAFKKNGAFASKRVTHHRVEHEKTSAGKIGLNEEAARLAGKEIPQAGTHSVTGIGIIILRERSGQSSFEVAREAR